MFSRSPEVAGGGGAVEPRVASEAAWLIDGAPGVPLGREQHDRENDHGRGGHARDHPWHIHVPARAQPCAILPFRRGGLHLAPQPRRCSVGRPHLMQRFDDASLALVQLGQPRGGRDPRADLVAASGVERPVGKRRKVRQVGRPGFRAVSISWHRNRLKGTDAYAPCLLPEPVILHGVPPDSARRSSQHGISTQWSPRCASRCCWPSRSTIPALRCSACETLCSRSATPSSRSSRRFSHDTSAGRLIERRGGDCGYMLMFEVDDLRAARQRVAEHGIREVWEVELGDIAEVHLHPADMQGAIVALSAPQPPGSWRWGGPDWPSRSVPGELHTVTVGVPDPNVTASLWQAVIGPIGTVRFVADADGRGPVAISLRASEDCRIPTDVAGVRLERA